MQNYPIYQKTIPSCYDSFKIVQDGIIRSSILLESLQLHSEVTHKLSLPYDLHTTCNLVTTVVNILESRCDHIHVVVCVHTASNAETEKVETTETVLTGYRIAVSEDVTDLTTTYTSLDVELDSECLSWELLLRDLVENAVSVYEDSVTTYRTLVRDSVLVELSCEVLNLLDTSLDCLELSVLIKTYCESSHVTAVHTTVCEEALEWDTESLCTFIPVLVTCCDKTTHVYETVLL